MAITIPESLRTDPRKETTVAEELDRRKPVLGRGETEDRFYAVLSEIGQTRNAFMFRGVKLFVGGSQLQVGPQNGATLISVPEGTETENIRDLLNNYIDRVLSTMRQDQHPAQGAMRGLDKEFIDAAGQAAA